MGGEVVMEVGVSGVRGRDGGTMYIGVMEVVMEVGVSGGRGCDGGGGEWGERS